MSLALSAVSRSQQVVMKMPLWQQTHLTTNAALLATVEASLLIRRTRPRAQRAMCHWISASRRPQLKMILTATKSFNATVQIACIDLFVYMTFSSSARATATLHSARRALAWGGVLLLRRWSRYRPQRMRPPRPHAALRASVALSSRRDRRAELIPWPT